MTEVVSEDVSCCPLIGAHVARHLTKCCVDSNFPACRVVGGGYCYASWTESSASLDNLLSCSNGRGTTASNVFPDSDVVSVVLSCASVDCSGCDLCVVVITDRSVCDRF